MSRTITVPLMILIPVAVLSPSQADPVWSDEFDGTSINPANWEHMIGNGTAYGLPAGWGNNELEYYTARPENSYVSGGFLHIIAREESYQGHDYTSARLRSLNRQEFRYGRLEARIKLPSGGGMWPAFWMLPTNSPYGGWAASGEIDIVETINNATTAYGTIHFGGQWPNNTANGGDYVPGVNLGQDFHVYRLDWEPDVMRWYFDGILYHTATSAVWYSTAAPENDRAPFDQFFHFLMNVAVGGNWPGCTNPSCITAAFPQEMVIDWIRVYELSPPTVEITSPADGADLPVGPVAIEATASDSDGSIDRVEFYADGTFLGDDSTAPYEHIWNATDGCYTLKATAFDDDGNSADDTIDVAVGTGCPPIPYYGTPQPIPGRIQAEDFDLGDEGEAYHDCDSGNNGGAYRPTSDVDIESSSGGGYNVGWMCANEWLDYVVEVVSSGTYRVNARVASQKDGGDFHIEFDGIDVTGAISVPATGGWQDWVTVNATADLASGVHEMRFVNGGTADEYNLTYFDFTLLYPLGDIDLDGDVDLADYAAFSACLAGPGTTTPPGTCTQAQFNRSDLDSDSDTDTQDYAAFQLALPG